MHRAETQATERVWLVDRTFSADWPNLIILTYATPDGAYEFREERAMTSFSDTGRQTTASMVVDRTDLTPVEDGTREQYAQEVSQIRQQYDPSDTI
ncbi:hypothetical protein [Halocatena halophila]|uniref:hypothetical protein n=1 Tax=Halocatena halophila TaxID=2814576 RepID=UPI002ED26B94